MKLSTYSEVLSREITMGDGADLWEELHVRGRVRSRRARGIEVEGDVVDWNAMRVVLGE